MSKGAMSPPSRHKIVVVDDSQIVLDLVQQTLQEQGYEVIATDNPLGFSNLLRREQPALALVDVTMPAMLGSKLVEIAVRAKGHDCQILLFSDRPETELAQMAASCGAAGYIRKSSDLKQLLYSVARFLRR
jgi:DNA-binding NtrC family response regulator